MSPLTSVFAQHPTDLRRFVDDLVSFYHPEKIVLFGSHARGDARSDSDVDLLVVMDHESKNPEVSTEIYMQLRPKFAMDLLVRKPKEIAHRIQIGDRFIQDVIGKGVVLHEADRS